MLGERTALKKRGCWRVVRTPEGVRLIKSRHVYKIKRNWTTSTPCTHFVVSPNVVTFFSRRGLLRLLAVVVSPPVLAWFTWSAIRFWLIKTFPRPFDLAYAVEGAMTCDPFLPDIPAFTSDPLESTEVSELLTESLCSILLMNPSLSLSLSPCPRFLDGLGDVLPLRIVLASTLGSLNSSKQFQLA